MRRVTTHIVQIQITAVLLIKIKIEHKACGTIPNYDKAKKKKKENSNCTKI